MLLVSVLKFPSSTQRPRASLQIFSLFSQDRCKASRNNEKFSLDALGLCVAGSMQSISKQRKVQPRCSWSVCWWTQRPRASSQIFSLSFPRIDTEQVQPRCSWPLCWWWEIKDAIYWVRESSVRKVNMHKGNSLSVSWSRKIRDVILLGEGKLSLEKVNTHKGNFLSLSWS